MFSIYDDVKFVLNFTRECRFSRFERSESWHDRTTVDDGAHVVYDQLSRLKNEVQIDSRKHDLNKES